MKTRQVQGLALARPPMGKKPIHTRKGTSIAAAYAASAQPARPKQSRLAQP